MDIFKEQFDEGLRSFLRASPNSLVLLQPSVRDILSDHPVLPQSELGRETLAENSADSVRHVFHLLANDLTEILQRIKLIPNPCRFSINGVSFATTSVDVLMHLKNQEFTQRGQEIDSIPPVGVSSATDMFTNLCRHILSQRRRAHTTTSKEFS